MRRKGFKIVRWGRNIKGPCKLQHSTLLLSDPIFCWLFSRDTGKDEPGAIPGGNGSFCSISTFLLGGFGYGYENEKNKIDYEARTSGILHILAKEGDTVKVGDSIGIMAESQEEYDAIVEGEAAASPAAALAPRPHLLLLAPHLLRASWRSRCPAPD